jgi:hypothetical protein
MRMMRMRAKERRGSDRFALRERIACLFGYMGRRLRRRSLIAEVFFLSFFFFPSSLAFRFV